MYSQMLSEKVDVIIFSDLNHKGRELLYKVVLVLCVSSEKSLEPRLGMELLQLSVLAFLYRFSILWRRVGASRSLLLRLLLHS